MAGMHILVLGGTRFLSKAVAQQALDRGHQVTCAARGVSGEVPQGARLVHWDRAAEAAPPDLLRAPGGLPWQAVVDVATRPGWVREALDGIEARHWVQVSTISVYADQSRPGGSAADTPLLAPVFTDADPRSTPEAYGAMKVGCEQLVRDAHPQAFIVRPGLIVGPGDSSGRFAYWPQHAHAAALDGELLLVPGAPTDPVQVIDVRDLASWIITAVEAGTEGSYDAVAPSLDRAAFTEQVLAGVGGGVELAWISSAELIALGVEEWMGPEAIPVWVADPGAAGLMARTDRYSVAAGLTTRPLAHTVRDTLDWLIANPAAPVTGISREAERELIRRGSRSTPPGR